MSSASTWPQTNSKLTGAIQLLEELPAGKYKAVKKWTFNITAARGNPDLEKDVAPVVYEGEVSWFHGSELTHAPAVGDAAFLDGNFAFTKMGTAEDDPVMFRVQAHAMTILPGITLGWVQPTITAIGYVVDRPAIVSMDYRAFVLKFKVYHPDTKTSPFVIVRCFLTQKRYGGWDLPQIGELLYVTGSWIGQAVKAGETIGELALYVDDWRILKNLNQSLRIVGDSSTGEGQSKIRLPPGVSLDKISSKSPNKARAKAIANSSSNADTSQASEASEAAGDPKEGTPETPTKTVESSQAPASPSLKRDADAAALGTEEAPSSKKTRNGKGKAS